MPGQRHLPIIKGPGTDATSPVYMRAIVSPCTGCANQTLVPADFNQDPTPGTKSWPCPKAVLYAQKEWAKKVGGTNYNYDHPIYDDKLRGLNPVPAGVTGHTNSYSYVFIATHEDNVDTGWNPGFRTDIIRCRGPFLVFMPERLLNCLGRLEQGDHVLSFSRYYWLDGAQFEGFVMEAATWQIHTSATRKIDTNLVTTVSGAK
jgi:hypothetical protein